MLVLFYAVSSGITQISKFVGPTSGPTGSCLQQMDPMLAPWTLLSGKIWISSWLMTIAVWCFSNTQWHKTGIVWKCYDGSPWIAVHVEKYPEQWFGLLDSLGSPVWGTIIQLAGWSLWHDHMPPENHKTASFQKEAKGAVAGWIFK